MMQGKQDTGRQAAVLAFAALLTDSFIQPFGRQTTVLEARLSILSNCVQLLALAGLIFLYLLAVRHKGQNKLAQYTLAVALVFSIALEIIQGERFYSYVIEQNLPVSMFLLLVFGAAFYGAYAGRATLGRVAWFVLMLTGTSVVLLVASVWQQLHVYNLQTPTMEQMHIFQASINQFYLPPELLLLPLLEPRGKTPKTALKVIGAVFIVNSCLSALGELTLGSAYTQQSLPVFTIARLGGISVFRRLDAAHVSIWLLLFLLKISLYFVSVVHIWRQNMPTKNRHQPYWVAIAGVMVLFFAFWNEKQNWALWIQQGLLAAVILCTVLGKNMKKEKKA